MLFVGVSDVKAKPCSIVTIKDDLITAILQLQIIKTLIDCVAPMSIWVNFYAETLPRSATGNSGHSLVSSCRQSMFVSSYTHLNNGSITKFAAVLLLQTLLYSLVSDFWTISGISIKCQNSGPTPDISTYFSRANKFLNVLSHIREFGQNF